MYDTKLKLRSIHHFEGQYSTGLDINQDWILTRTEY